ncbi:hypothetical protein HMPREF1092_00936 [Clostridium thermobutyricum]|uniref:DUF4352 domain-containing protein n=1 Tax=Clostridium thermobutyricum TaxID=29372 RepID=N9Y1M5_9CLOT|nr:DUF4352 domain-containing protein [Clostridium thermobutyricum]ENZ01702.1 hypothetical protein HMPREF1092_00936 [Clostridium thermobutyricum]
MSSEKVKKKKSKKFKIGIGIIIVIVVLFIIGSIGGSNNSPKAVNSSSSHTQSNPVFKIGQTFKIGNYNITVDSVKNEKVITDNGFTADTTQNNFSIYKVTVENTSNQPIEGFNIGSNSNGFTLDIDNSKYAPDLNSSSDVNTANNTSNAFNIMVGTQLNPHTKYTCYLSFITPKSVKHGTILVNIDEETGKVQI